MNNEERWDPGKWDEALQSLRDEPVDEALFEEVRVATLARIRRDRRRPWMYGAVAVAAALVLAMGLSLRTEKKEVAAAPEKQMTAPLVAKALAPAAPELVMAPAPRRQQGNRRPALAKEPMKIHLMTDDPDVVIIWLVGEEGDTE